MEAKNVSYSEKQRFSQWWLWLILIGAASIPFFGLYYQIGLDKPFGNNPLSDTGLMIFAVLMIAFLGFFFLMRLNLTLDREGITVRFFPFFTRAVTWEEVEHLQVVNYGFVGGYGIRLTHRFGTVYNMSGRWGLLIYLEGGKRFCVGTRNKDELRRLLKTMDLKQI